MKFFLILKIVAFSLSISYLINYYAQKNVRFYIKVVVFFSWTITFLPLVLLPEDIYYSLQTQQGVDTSEVKSLLFICWETTLGLSYIFGYLIIPLLQSYIGAGEFTTKSKLRRAIMINVMFYVYMSIPGGLVVLALYKFDREHFFGNENVNLIGILRAFANCFGLFLLLVLLGYGLVNVPRITFRRGNKEVWLKYSYFQIAVADEQRLSATYDFEEVLNTVVSIENDNEVEPELRRLCELMRKQVPPEVNELARLSPNDKQIKVPVKITEKFLISLREKLKRRVQELQRFERKWETLTEYAVKQEDINHSRITNSGVIKYSFKPQRGGYFAKILDKLEFFWEIKAESYTMYGLGAFFTLLSLAVFILEITIFKIIRFDFTLTVEEYTYSQVVSMVPLVYMAVCAYYGLFNFNFAGLYGLYPNKQTDPGSLLFACGNFLRIAYPLAYNFLMMIRVRKTSYNQLMGSIDLESGIGHLFNNYFPIVLGLLVLANVFDIYGKLLGGLGLSNFKFTESFNDEKIEEGRRLLQAEKDRIELRNRTKDNDGDKYVSMSDESSLETEAYALYAFSKGNRNSLTL